MSAERFFELLDFLFYDFVHVYIFDAFLSQPRYEKTVAKIETRLTDLGLNGKNCRVGALKSIKSVVTEELRNTPKTIVAVGNDATFNSIINALAEHDVMVGIIPVGPKNSIARAFGIADEDEGCNVLAARLVERIDVGYANTSRFVLSATIENAGTIMEVNESFTVEPTGTGVTSIINISDETNSVANPYDGLFELYVTVQKKRLLSHTSETSALRSNKIIANNFEHRPFILDNSIEVKTPTSFSILPKDLTVIVGKQRVF